MSDIAVVHLVWHALGSGALQRFMDSYRQHDAGIAHRLVLVYKEFPEGAGREDFHAAAGDVPHERIEMPGTVFDIPAYFRIAAERPERFFCFLNSQATILVPQWLALLHRHAIDPAVGVVGATGSWESHLSGAINHVHYQAQQHNVPVTDELLRNNIPPSYFDFPPFPNAHIRTNGFMITRERLSGLPFVPASDKQRCYLFESGRQGMTMQLQRQGLRTVVVGRDGRAYDPAQWPDSRTFRGGDQENLLIADSHTQSYLAADAQERARLRFNAWGERGRT